MLNYISKVWVMLISTSGNALCGGIACLSATIVIAEFKKLDTSGLHQKEIQLIKRKRQFYVMHFLCWRFFVFRANRTIEVQANPSQPQIVSYNMAGASKEEVLVKFESDDSHCSIASVQDAVCPVYDQPDDVVYQGTYQTFTKKAGIVVHVSCTCII